MALGERPFGPSGKRTRRRACESRRYFTRRRLILISMRQLVLDTETTGLNARTGDRIIEIGCVELVNRRLTGNNLHFYVNLGRDSDPGALAVHGLTTEFLSDKPKFADIAAELRDFVAGAELIIHNAPFDVGVMDVEFGLVGMSGVKEVCVGVIDTLVQAKQMFPSKLNSLDALCDRFGISNAHRTLHGGLLDAVLLAEVYLAMTRGQNSLTMDLSDGSEQKEGGVDIELVPLADVLVLAASEEEQGQHEALLDGLDKA